MKRKLLIVLIMGLSGTSYAGNGTTTASFLNTGSGARPLALAGAYAGLGDDVQSIFWNPAGLSLLNRSEASVTYQDLGENVRQQSLSFGTPLNRFKGSFGSSLLLQSVGDVQGYDSGGLATSNLKDQDLAFSLAYAAPFRERWHVGANVKWIRERLDSVTANGYAADLGLVHPTSVDGLKWGASVRNLGPGLNFISEKSDLPTDVRIGASYSRNVTGGRASFACDLSSPRSEKRTLVMGAEYIVAETVALRLGYAPSADLTRQLRFGLGVFLRNLNVDYAFLPRGVLDDSHRVTISYKFGHAYNQQALLRSVDNRLALGERALQQGDVGRAYREFDAVLAVEPGNLEAQRLIALTRLQAETAFKDKQLNEAVASAISLYDSSDITGAKSEFQNVLTLDPDNKIARQYIALIDARFQEVAKSVLESGRKFLKQGYDEKALSEFERVLVFEPGHKEATGSILNICDKLIKRGSLDKASQVAKRLSALQPQNEDVAALNVSIAEKQKKLNLYALQEKKKRLFDKGMGHRQAGRVEQAKKTFEDVLALDPGDKSAALELAKIANEMNENLTASLYQKALKEIDARNWKDSILHLEAALKLAPKRPEISQALEKARASQRKLDKEELEGLYTRAAEQYAKGHFKQAAEILRQMLKIDPNNTDAKQYLEKIEALLQRKR